MQGHLLAMGKCTVCPLLPCMRSRVAGLQQQEDCVRAGACTHGGWHYSSMAKAVLRSTLSVQKTWLGNSTAALRGNACRPRTACRAMRVSGICSVIPRKSMCSSTCTGVKTDTSVARRRGSHLQLPQDCVCQDDSTTGWTTGAI